MTRLESTVRDNSTMRALTLCRLDHPPVPSTISEAILKGAVHNKGLGLIRISVPDTSELHKLVDEVEQENSKLILDVEYYEVGVCFYCLYVFVCQQIPVELVEFVLTLFSLHWYSLVTAMSSIW